MNTILLVDTISTKFAQLDTIANNQTILNSADNLNEIIQQVQSFYESAWSNVITLLTFVIIVIPLVNIIIQTWMIKALIKNEIRKTEKNVNAKLQILDSEYQDKIKEIEKSNQDSFSELKIKINKSKYLSLAEIAIAKAENISYNIPFKIRHLIVAIDYYRTLGEEKLENSKNIFNGIIKLLKNNIGVDLKLTTDDFKFINSKLNKFFKDNYDEEYLNLVFETKKLMKEFEIKNMK